MTKTYLITGASEGIGLETARLAVSSGAAVLMVARDAAKLQAAANGLPGAIRPQIAAVDLADPQALDALIADLDAQGYVPDVLVNNAGHGASGAFVDADWAKIDVMLRLNINALARLSHWAARGMKARKSGAIVNLSAAVATRPTPYFAAYAASKAFVTNLSIAMFSELRASGVSVSAIHPPAVRTSFGTAGKADLKTTLVHKLFPTVGPKTVARAVMSAVRRRRRSVIIGPVAAIVMGTAPILPRGFDLAFMTLLFKGKRVAD
ncbi:MAG: SDR family NAD(P)-dependent oxidoreductase [Sphingomonas sp.]|nr:SDR family NAD(P)-dependent oxidoreductase [Sphingomonas sp.]